MLNVALPMYKSKAAFLLLKEIRMAKNTIESLNKRKRFH